MALQLNLPEAELAVALASHNSLPSLRSLRRAAFRGSAEAAFRYACLLEKKKDFRAAQRMFWQTIHYSCVHHLPYKAAAQKRLATYYSKGLAGRVDEKLAARLRYSAQAQYAEIDSQRNLETLLEPSSPLQQTVLHAEKVKKEERNIR
ncbi:MAG: hypothetical protein L7S42_01660 [Flavobacteriaceae bacterium]|nr:hypothetical protein [Flavobacteriaceae bacterium]